MSISTTTNRVSYAGDGSTTVFPYNFLILANTDLEVIETVTATGVETIKTLTTHYTVSGAGTGSGNVTMVTAPASGTTLTIRRKMPRTQLVDYVENDSFPAATHEQALDKLTMITQELDQTVKRSLRQPEGDSADINLLPSVVTRASKYLSFDSNGHPIATSLINSASATPEGVGFDHVVDVDSYTSFADAVVAIGSLTKTLLVGSNKAVTANVTVPSTLTLWFVGQGQLTISAGMTVTINGPIEASPRQIFAGSGAVSIGAGRVREVPATWWGVVGDGSTDNSTALDNAIAALPSTGMVLVLPSGTINHDGTVLNKHGLTIRGAGINATTMHNTGSGVNLTISSETNYVTLEEFKLTGGTGTTHGIHVIDSLWFKAKRVAVNSWGNNSAGIRLDTVANPSGNGTYFAELEHVEINGQNRTGVIGLHLTGTAAGANRARWYGGSIRNCATGIQGSRGDSFLALQPEISGNTTGVLLDNVSGVSTWTFLRPSFESNTTHINIAGSNAADHSFIHPTFASPGSFGTDSGTRTMVMLTDSSGSGLHSKLRGGYEFDKVGGTAFARRQDNTTNSTQNPVAFQSGWAFITGDGATVNFDKSITFPTAFNAAPVVLITPLGERDTSDPTAIGDFVNLTYTARTVAATNIATTGFNLRTSFSSAPASGRRVGYAWLAIGPLP